MAAHMKCNCGSNTSFANPANMRVYSRNKNYSYFEKPKGEAHYSEWSTLKCIGGGVDASGWPKCGMSVRSKSKKVSEIPDLVFQNAFSQDK